MRLSEAIKQRSFAGLVGVDESVVSRLVARGVLRPGSTAQEWLRAYCAHLRFQAERRIDTPLESASAALKDAQREEVQLRLAARRREYAPAGAIDEVLRHVGRSCAFILSGLPHAIHLQWPHATAEQQAFIDAEVARARNLMASVSLADLDADESDDEAAST